MSTSTKTQPIHPEHQYLDLVRRTIQSGARRPDRTGTGTLSTFGAMMRFDLSDGSFPLLTTKRVFWKGVVEELLWFLSGSTDSKVLSARGVKIWDANGSKEALAARGLVDREEGDLGPVYAFQWRHWGAEYIDSATDYTRKGFDQLADCVRRIRQDPTDRRIVMSAWNVGDLPKMALPPCHMMCQFYVADQKLSCLMYQRSADLGLGVPFNIASYALLTCLVAQACGLQRGEFVHTMGDAHVYIDHVDPLLEQLKRDPRPFPKLRLNERLSNVDDFSADDIVLEDYRPHPPIQMQMSV